MGFLSSPLLCLRSALIRKFSVSQDNAPPLKTPLQPLGFLDPDQQLARSRENVGSGLLTSGESPAVARVCLGEPHTAHKHIYAPLTLGRREGQMAAPEKGTEGGCLALTWPRAGGTIDVGKPTATAHLLGPDSPPGPQAPAQTPLRKSEETVKARSQPRAWRMFRTYTKVPFRVPF